MPIYDFDFDRCPTDADFDWTDEQEERAAGWPGAMPNDYQDPALTASLLDQGARDSRPYPTGWAGCDIPGHQGCDPWNCRWAPAEPWGGGDRG